MNETSPPGGDRPVVVADNRSRVSLHKHAGVSPGQMFLLAVDEVTGVISLVPASAVPISMIDPATA